MFTPCRVGTLHPYSGCLSRTSHPLTFPKILPRLPLEELARSLRHVSTLTSNSGGVSSFLCRLHRHTRRTLFLRLPIGLLAVARKELPSRSTVRAYTRSVKQRNLIHKVCIRPARSLTSGGSTTRHATNQLIIDRWISYNSFFDYHRQGRCRSRPFILFCALPTNSNPFHRPIRQATHSLIPFDGSSTLAPNHVHLSITANDFYRQSRRTDVHSLSTLPPTTHNMAFRPMSRQLPTYGYCDTFFVEGDDEGVYARAAAERENARQIGKLRQKALAEELSRATAEEYQEDVLDHMEHMEVCASQD